VANVGVHGQSVQLDLQDLRIKNIHISMGLVNTTTLGMLLKLVAKQKFSVDQFVTHRFALDDVAGYETFGNAAQTHALKVRMSR
jgi:alcohol dehydrogenase